MEGRSAVWLLLLLLLLEALISAEAQNTPEYLEVGGKLVLTPAPKLVRGRIRSIEWRLNGKTVGVLEDGEDLEYSSLFRGRASVDTTTGVLEISNARKSDSGVFTVEINDRNQARGHDVKVIKRVPKPVAMMTPLTCNQQSESCLLSCDGDITEAGPVTFYFKKGDGDWEEGEQSINIINDATTQAVPTFSCRMKNPLGETDSEPVDNVFYVGSNTGMIVGAVLGVLAAVGVAVGGGVAIYHHNRADQPEEAPLLGQQP